MRHARPRPTRFRPALAGAAATCLVIAGAVAGVAHWRSGPAEPTAVVAAGQVSGPPVATATGDGDPATRTSAAPARVPALGPLAAAPKRPAATPPKTRPPGPPAVPPAPRGGKPGAGNTGVPAGTALKVVTGDQTFGTSGQVVSGLDIRGKVRITGKNVTLQNSVVRGPTGGGCTNGAVIEVGDSATATIRDTDVVASNPTACLDGVSATNATLIRVDISNVVDGVKAYDNVTVQDSYVHDLRQFASDPNQGGGATHNDAVQTFVGNSGITLRHNTLLPGKEANAALQVTQDGGGRATNIRVEGNWLDGGGCTLNFSHNGGPTPMTGIYVTGNRFGRNSTYDCPILLSTQTQLSANSGNVWDDTGAAIPAPQRHD